MGWQVCYRIWFENDPLNCHVGSCTMRGNTRLELLVLKRDTLDQPTEPFHSRIIFPHLRLDQPSFRPFEQRTSFAHLTGS